MIEIEGVSLSIGTASILQEIDMTVPKGGITALVGPNGAGKSTLLALVARLLPMQAGTIRVDGLTVGKAPSRELAKVLAILRQDPGVATRLRVSELVGFGRFPHHQGRLNADDRLRVANALAQFDLTGLADRFIDTLSGGQRQRAMVAMTFCQGTDYLLLDEPLNNLDMYHARKLMQVLRRIADEEGKTILIVLHDINHAVAYADRVVIMKQGRIVAHGATAATATAENLADAFGFDMRVETVNGMPFVLHHR